MRSKVLLYFNDFFKQEVYRDVFDYIKSIPRLLFQHSPSVTLDLFDEDKSPHSMLNGGCFYSLNVVN